MSAFRKQPRGRNTSQRVVHWVDIPLPAPRPRRTGRPVPGGEERPREESPAPAASPAEGPAATGPAQVGLPALADLDRLEEALLARAAARLGQAQAPAGGAADRRRVEQLERRLRKLSGELDDRDRLLRQLLARTQEDPGLASLTSEAGLDQADEQYEAKKEMMSSIFQANLELRRRVQGQG